MPPMICQVPPVRIHVFTYRVLPYDTNFGWILIRIRADSLVPAGDPASAASVFKNVVERFGMSTLARFEAQERLKWGPVIKATGLQGG